MDIFHCSSYPSFWIGSLSLLPKINFLSIGILEKIPPYSHAGASSFSTGNFLGNNALLLRRQHVCPRLDRGEDPSSS